MAKYDIYKIEERMKELSWRLKRIEWDDSRKRYEIIAIDNFGEEYIAITVPAGKLDNRVLLRLKEIDPTNGYNPFRELEKMQEQKERDEEKRRSDMAYSMADVLYKPLIKDAFY